MSAHRFAPARTVLAKSKASRCSGCGVARRRVVAMPSGAVLPYAAMKVRSFYLYRFGAGAWTTAKPACTGLRA
jgi:hypothetical protein